MTTSRADIAAMLRAGATYKQIQQQLHVSHTTITRTRRALRIPTTPDRTKRTRAELAALEDQAVAMLRDGATYKEIRSTTRLSPNRISDLRKTHNIPLTSRRQRQANARADRAYTAIFGPESTP